MGAGGQDVDEQLSLIASMTQASVFQDIEEEQLWACFREERHPEMREKLVDRYAAFATMMAATFYAKRQVAEIEFDEFRQYSLLGLIEAIDRFDPSRGASFKTFASYRIKGAVLNGIEKYSEQQQQISLRTRLRRERAESLMPQSSNHSTFEELVEATLGLAVAYMLEDSGLCQVNEAEGWNEAEPYRSRAYKDLSLRLADLIASLSLQEKTVVKYHYFQQFTFEEIADQLALTKGRISQIHKNAIKRLNQYHDQLKLLRTDV